MSILDKNVMLQHCSYDQAALIINHKNHADRLTSDGFGTGSAPFRKKFTKAFSTIRLVVPEKSKTNLLNPAIFSLIGLLSHKNHFLIPGSESLTSQGLCAVSAGETFTMPRVIAICYTTLCDHLKHK